ncbi:adenylate kinase [Clostridia bacterium]|nr:adenylate kinase [Clostridia bacterium]
MRLLVMGPPGSGKGTQAAILSDRLNIPHISTGEMFRDAIKMDSELGKLAARYINKGELVPDEITEAIVKERLSQEDCQEGYLLDGFPRTLIQGRALDSILHDVGNNIDCVIYLDVPTQDIVSRLTARRICGVCGAVYHLQEKPPRVEGVCDSCGGEIVHREDDTEETVRKRLCIYNDATRPLVDFYQQKNLLCTIEGNLSIDETTERIVSGCF